METRRTLARLWLALLAGLVLLLAAPAGTASGRPRQAASLSLTPSSGPPGTTVTVYGSGFPPSGGTPPHEIHWDSLAGPVLGTFTTNPNGAFTATIVVPANASPGGHTVIACAGCNLITRPPITASATFQVTPPIAAPTPVIVLPPIRTACDPRGGAGELVIDFDDLAVGTRLDGQTRPGGVTFLGEDALVVFTPRVTTRSQRQALMNDFAGREFGSINVPVRIGFETLQDFVGMFVGLNERVWADEPLTATLTAFGYDAEGRRVVVGSDTETFGPGATPITRCLAVEAAGRIFEVTLNYDAPGGAAEPEVLDDLIVRGPEVPVPLPVDDRPPRVEIESPADGSLISEPYPRLQGTVREDRALARLELWLNGRLYRELGASPEGYADDGDRLYRFGLNPIPLAELQPCADNLIEVRAYDTSGNQGADRAAVAVWVGDLALESAEAVQALFGAPLVHGKSTAFRIRVSSTFDCPVETLIRLELPEGQWDTHPPSSGHSVIGVPPGYAYPSAWGPVRIPAHAAAFEIMLPPIAAGEEGEAMSLATYPQGLVSGGEASGIYGPQLRNVPRPRADEASFAVELDPAGALAEMDEDNNRLEIPPQPVLRTRPVRMVFVPWLFDLDPGPLETESDYRYYLRESGYSDVDTRIDAARAALDGGRVPLHVALAEDDVERLEREARRFVEFFLGSFPIADSQISYRLIDNMYFQAEYLSAHGYNPCHYWNWHEDVNDLVFATYPDTDVVILFRVMGCCGQSPGVYVDAGLELAGSPPDWRHRVNNPDLSPGDAGYACWDWTFPLQGAAEYVIGHELNHWFLHMPGECYACSQAGHLDVDCASCTLDAEGFWVNRWQSFALGSPYFSHSVCDGCEYWNRLDPSWKKSGVLNPDGYRAAIEAFASIADPQVLIVRGDAARSGEVTLDAFMLMPEGVPDLAPGAPGAYSLVLLGAQEQVLGTWGFDVSFTVYGPPPSLPVEVERAHFAHRVEWPEEVARIELRDGAGRVVAARAVSAHAPQVRVLEPNGGETLRGRATTVRWEAQDADGDELSFTLALSSDGGETWTPLEIDLEATSHRLGTAGLAPGTEYVVRVLASDGVHTAFDVSDAPFSIAERLRLPVPAAVAWGAAGLAAIGVGLIAYGLLRRPSRRRG